MSWLLFVLAYASYMVFSRSIDEESEEGVYRKRG